MEHLQQQKSVQITTGKYAYLSVKLKSSELMFSIDELFDSEGVMDRTDLFNLFGRHFMDQVFKMGSSLSTYDRELLKLLITAQDKPEFLDKLKIVKQLKRGEQSSEVSIDVI